MRTSGIRLILPLLVLAAAATAQGQEKPAAGADYMPLKVGNKWLYKADFGGQTVEVGQSVAKIEKKDGKDIAQVETEFGGQVITEQISSSDKGVFRYSFQGQPVDPPIQALKLPAKKGDTWDVKFSVQGQEMKAVMKTEGEEEVTVPAGKYKAVIVSMEMDAMGQKVAVTSWFAPNVGIVKQKFDLGGISGTSELEKFTPAK